MVGWVSGRALVACTGAAAMLLAAAVALTVARVCWRGVPTERAALAARLRLLPESVLERRILARLDILEGRPRVARARLVAAIRRAPFSSILWLERAEAALFSGRAEEARDAARRAVALAPTDAAGYRRAALVLLQTGDGEGAAPLLRRVIVSDPARAGEIFDLAHAVYADPHIVLERVVPPEGAAVRAMLAWAHARRLLDAARLGWEALAAHGPTASDRLAHIDFLIAEGDIESADALWGVSYGQRPAGSVYDGDFERDPVGAGFGWVFAPPARARVAIDGTPAAAHGGRGLAIEFRGGNLDVVPVSQVVPVRGGRRYRLSALVRTEEVTSLAGPRLRVESHPSCTGRVAVEGAELRGTLPWGPASVEFVVPPGCGAVVIGIRRRATTRLDRDLRGRLYVDDVRLTDLGEAESALDAARG